MATWRRELGVALPALVALGALVAGGPARAYPLSARSKEGLKRDFARMRFSTAKDVVELQVYNLKQARGVVGFTLGRHRSKDGKQTFGGVVIYHRCGEGLCMSSVTLNSANRVRAVRLLDLETQETAINISGGPWFAPHSGELTEPPRRARWPVLVVQIEREYEGHKTQQVSLIGLRKPKSPRLLTRITTLSTYKEKAGRGPRRRSLYNGTRRFGLRAVHAPGKPPRLLAKEKRISSRFNRCREPEPEQVAYELKEGRFVELPRKAPPPGCR